MRQSRTLDIGMDVHKDSMAVAYGAKDHAADVIYLGPSGTRHGDIDHRIRKLHSKAPHRVFVSEAGPCGDGLSRYLTKQGHVCWVVAPALIPNKAGARVPTARRDVVPRARLMRAGALTPVYVPTGADEAIGDLTRAREDTLRALQAAQLRLKAFLLRHDIRDTGRAPWSPAPLRWLREVVCPTPAPQMVFQEDVRAVTEHTARLPRRAQELTEPVNTWRLPPVVDALQALRGVPCTVAVTTLAERGDLTRVDPPRQLMKFLGLIPSASSSGARRRQGSITKAGHTHARRALVEGAWASRYPATGSRPLQRRLENHPKAIQDVSCKAQVRRCTRDRRLRARGKHANQVVVAMARELAGFMWAIAKQGPVTP